MNIYSLAKKFPSEEHALAYLMKVRWPRGVRCVYCDHDKCWLVDSKGKTGKPRRLFQCAKCKEQFTATSGTLFHDSHLPLTKWFAAITLMADAKKGMSAAQIQRHVGMTYKTAWYVCHRIREAMQEASGVKVGGPNSVVEIDESYVGGRKRLTGTKAGRESKTLVLGIVERGGNIHMETISSRKLAAIKPVLDAKLHPDTSEVVTDSHSAYTYAIPREKHTETCHKEELRHGNVTSTQAVESAFSLFKRGLIGQYHQLSPWHMDRYLREFCWRFNRRGLQPWIFGMALENMTKAKPMPYKELVKF